METIKQFLTDLTRLSKLRADSLELHRIRRFAMRQDRRLNDTANDGRDARPPDGDDWNDLAAQTGIFDMEDYR